MLFWISCINSIVVIANYTLHVDMGDEVSKEERRKIATKALSDIMKSS